MIQICFFLYHNNQNKFKHTYKHTYKHIYKHGKFSIQRNILFKKRDKVLFFREGSLNSGVITEIHDNTYIVKTLSDRIEVNESNLFVTLKDALVNILSRVLLSNGKKQKYIEELFENQTIFEKLFYIEEKIDFTKMNHSACGVHKSKKSCDLNQECFYRSTISLFDRFKQHQERKIQSFVKIRLLQDHFDIYENVAHVLEKYINNKNTLKKLNYGLQKNYYTNIAINLYKICL